MGSKRATTPGFRDGRYRALIDRLVAKRAELGLTQEAVGGRLGLHKQFVSRYELGERRLDAIELIDVCHALGLSAAALISEVE